MKHGLPSNQNADNFVESAKKLLSHAKHTLDKLGIRFWLSSGTCLGGCAEKATYMAYSEYIVHGSKNGLL